MHVDAPSALYVFTLHDSHEVMREAVVSALGLDVPAKHCVQATPTSPQLPLLHLQEESAVLRELASEPELVGQLEHVVDVPATLYVSTPHGVHSPPFSPLYPALHLQSDNAVLPFKEFEYVGHVSHVVAVFASVLYPPASHSRQRSPATTLPAGHPGTHMPYNPPKPVKLSDTPYAHVPQLVALIVKPALFVPVHLWQVLPSRVG